MSKRVIVHLHHAPMVLRVDEMVEREPGIKIAVSIGEIPLARGRNEIDAELWAKWSEQNKAGPLMTGGLIHEETPENQRDDQTEK